MTKIEKLSDAITGERAEYIVPISLVVEDDGFFDDELFSELAIGDEEGAEWFEDKRIGKWSDFRNSLTSKDLCKLV